MCGRYIIREAARAERYFQVHGTPWSASYNIAPSQMVPVVRLAEGRRVGINLRWGLIPYFAKGVPGKYPTHNARIETVETAASYRGAWNRGQRCIQVADGFYEWHVNAEGKKHPFFIHLNDQESFGFAALWDRSFASDGTVIESVAHITMSANDLMRQVHNAGSNPYRMPAILRREDHEAWLHGTPEVVKALLVQYPSDLMVAYQVSDRVNKADNNDETLIEPVAA